MAEKNKNVGYKILLKLSYGELTDENIPAFYLSRPEICALYKKTKTDELEDDFRLKYFKMPKLTSYPLDLNEGFYQYIFRREATNLQLMAKVIKFILEANNNILQPDSSQKTEASSQPEPEVGKTQLPLKRKLVLSQRGVLARLMLIPYRLNGSEYNDCTFHAIRYYGILHIVDPVQSGGKTKNDTYHRKFEQICYSDHPDLDPITDVPVDDNISTYAIYRSNIKEFDLIYSGEFSGVTADHKIDDIHNLDEINKCKFIQTKLLWKQNNIDILKHPKCLLWWAQLYLANTNDLCIGLKDKDGVVRTPVQLFKVQNIPKNQKWKPFICNRFLLTVLTLIDDTMSKVNCPYTVYEFKYDSHAGCIKSKIHRGKTEFSFLSENYIKHCKEQNIRK